MKRSIALLAGMALFSACASLAHAHEAHVHGVANLNVAIEDNEVELEFDSPLANLLSFEHAPQTAAEKLEAEKMIGIAGCPENLFVLSVDAGCTMKELHMGSDALAVLLQRHGYGQHIHHDHDDQQHEHPAGHDHGDAHEPHDHADMEIELEYMCAHPEKLRSLRASAFRSFPSLHEIHVQMIMPSGQQAATLTPSSGTMRW